MTKDHLDSEISVKAELTESGVQAKAYSRTLSALDRLVGSVVDWANTPLETFNAEKRAVADARRKVIVALGDKTAELIARNPDGVLLDLEAQLPSILRKQDNKRHVGRAAIEELRQLPPTAEESASGEETLADDFLTRFERYAEDAASDELRAKWGKILAAELRKPGSVSRKTMRVVDELDAPTALLFQDLVRNRLDDVVPLALAREQEFTEISRLVDAGLIIEPGLTGKVALFATVTSHPGVELWIRQFENFAIGWPKSHGLGSVGTDSKAALVNQSGTPGLPVYMLSAAGVEIASIFERQIENVRDRLVSIIATTLGGASVTVYRKENDKLVPTAVITSRPPT